MKHLRLIAVLAVASAIVLGLTTGALHDTSSKTKGASSGTKGVEQGRRTRSTDCFENPETEGTRRFEECGYPGPGNTGVQDCAGLEHTSGGKTITQPEVIENTDITGSLEVDAANVTLNHDCVVANGHEALGTQAIRLDSAASNFTLSNSTVRAENSTTDSFEEAVQNNGPSPAANAILVQDRLEDCTECIHNAFTVDKSYAISNGMQKREEEHKGEIHREVWFYWGATVSAKDDTMLDPYTQVSVMFGEGGAPCENHLTIEDSFVVGGDWVFTPCSKSTGAGASTMTIKNNRFARCLGREKGVGEGPEGYECKGSAKAHDAKGFDSHGYFPRGGWQGPVWEYYTGRGQVWKGNYWDDNLENVVAGSA